MKKQEHMPKLITYAACMAAVALGVIILMLVFHCPLGWKVVLWIGMAALSLILLWPMKRYERTVPVLTAVYLSASLLCCTYVDPYFIKEALASEGSPFAKGNVWLVAWVLLAIGVFYIMVHLVTGLMDRLSPNDELFDGDGLSAKAKSVNRRVVFSAVLATIVVAVGIFSAVIYNGNVADIPEKAPCSEADYTVVMPNLQGKLADEATNTVGYGAYYQVHYNALENLPVSEYVHAGQSANGSALLVSVILRHKDHTFDPAKTATIDKITLTEGLTLYGPTTSNLSEEDRNLVISLMRGDVTATPVEVIDPSSYGYIKVTFTEYDHLWWEASVMEKDGKYYLRVATNTDFSVKDQRYDPQYAFYPLDDIN